MFHELPLFALSFACGRRGARPIVRNKKLTQTRQQQQRLCFEAVQHQEIQTINSGLPNHCAIMSLRWLEFISDIDTRANLTCGHPAELGLCTLVALDDQSFEYSL